MARLPARRRSQPGALRAPKGPLRPADREAMGRTRRGRELLRAPPALVFAALLHLALIYLAQEYLLGSEVVVEREARSVRAEFVEEEEEAFTEPPAPPTAKLEEPPPLDDLELPDAPDQPLDETVDLVAARAVLGLGMGQFGSGGGGGGGGSGAGDGGASLPVGLSADDPFARFVGDLRERGLDVVFVVDATGSMQRFLDRAREVLDDIAGDLEAVVPSMRLGFVAYRDLADDWVTLSSALSADRYRVANVLLDLRASGGRRGSADLPEAVEEGLRVAVEELDWRDGARRVILLVGDAPYHDEDRAAALNAVRSFARAPRSHVNSLHIRSAGANMSSNELATAEAFGRIVQAGDGVAFEWSPDDSAAAEQLRARVRQATFGREWMDEIDALLAARGPDPRAAAVQRHAQRGDRKWLARRLFDETVHPLVVDACVKLLDRSLGEHCLARLAARGSSTTQRNAILYIFKTAIPALRGAVVDVERPLEKSGEPYRLIQRAVADLKLAPPGKRATLGKRASPIPPLPTPGAASDG